VLAECRACGAARPSLAHASPLARTLTSECKLRAGRLRIYLCANCAHVMSDEGGFDDVRSYYEREYDSLLDVPEADDLYDLDAAGQPVYRAQIQLDNLARLLNVPGHGRLLDFGCGKGGFLGRFRERHPAWELAGFDVSERYRRPVEAVAGANRFRVGRPDDVPDLGGPFDIVTMFFVVEHLEHPCRTLARVAAHLAEGGLLYLTVPNVLTNSIDAFLADHLSHFSTASLTVLLHRCGLRPVVVSEHHQLGQITLAATPEPAFAATSAPRVDNDLVRAYTAKVRTAIDHWVDAGRRLHDFLATRPRDHGALAVYGAGVFGSYLAIHAGRELDAIACFLDQNPFKVGKRHLGKPIIHPSKLPGDVTDVLVGLNPTRAPDILRQAGLLARPGLRLFLP